MYVQLKALLFTSRPALWWTIGLVFTAGAIASSAAFDTTFFLFLFLLMVPGCFVLFGLNDVYDYDSDKQNARKDSLAGAALEPKYHDLVLQVSAGISVFMFLILLSTRDVFTITTGLILAFLAYAYSVPPLRFSEVPVLDALSNAGLILCTILLGFSLSGSFFEVPTQIYVLGVVVVGMHSFFSLMDYSADKAASKNTLMILIGKRPAMIISLIIVLCCLGYFVLFSFSTPIVVFLSLVSALFVILTINPSESFASQMFWPVLLVGAVCAAFLLVPYV